MHNPFKRSSILGVQKGRRKRDGVAAVEFAVCLPVIVLLVFGSIEASSFIFLKQSLSVACYEAAREASQSGSTEAEADARGLAILESRSVNDFEIRFPSGVDELQRGEQVVCEVSAPTRTNSPIAGEFVTNRTLVARVVMLKE
ncbi:pilus assembly protein [Stieleria sp. ICT_E10.1]|uniref:TadE/TadG family type IV pilus assembly protein n=1 Tax=Stieleria sedimenti TaxID=2976331 RepID=UPI00218038C1|nr:TadE family protein [Stieleria sedimenti]MCS7465272.1 pilus assembly protein [Stieleria sedimenti]